MTFTECKVGKICAESALAGWSKRTQHIGICANSRDYNEYKQKVLMIYNGHYVLRHYTIVSFHPHSNLFR